MQLIIAAALAVVAALAEFTVVPYLKIGDAVPHPVLVFGVICGHRGWSRSWASPGPSSVASPSTSSASDRSARPPSRCSSPSASAPSSADLLGRVQDPRPDHRHRHREPRLLHAAPRLDHRPLDRRRSLSRPSLRSILPSTVYDIVLAAIVGPLAIAIVARRREAGAGGLVNDVLARRQSRARPATDPVPRVRHRHDPRVRPADDAARLPPDHQRHDASPPGAEAQRDGRGGDPGAPRPDLRPQGPAARHERRDLGGQDHALRPPVQPTATTSPQRLGPLLGMEPTDILDHARQRPGLAVRSRPDRRRTSPRRPRASSSESTDELPGVQVAVETRREYPDGAAPRAHPRLHRPGRRRHVRSACAADGYLARRPDRQDRRRVDVRGRAARDLRRRARRDATRPAATSRCSGPSQQAVPGASLRADHRPDDPARGDPGPQVGHEGRRPQARRVHRDEPADGRGARAGEPAELRQQRSSRAGSRSRPSRSCSRTRTSR